MNYIDKDKKFLAQTYTKQPVALVEGKGAVVKDAEGRKYIDCFSGLAVLNVGHSSKKVVEAIKKQSAKIMHSSNVYYILPQVELAELLYKISGGYKSFMCNSGAEANEAAIKLVRKYTGKSEIIAAENSFHGRTLATLSATGQSKYKKGFEPMLKEFKHVKFNDSKAIENAITAKTAAVMLEPIQGEGGVIVPSDGYLKEVRKICDDEEILLVLDEVQTGFGRTGAMFAWQLFGAKPDIFTLAKSLGGGFPIGAMLAKPEIMDAFEKGSHASTFGGNHLACAAAKAAIETILEDRLAERSRKLGDYLKNKLVGLKDRYGVIKEVRGKGMMIGIELKVECRDMVDRMRERGVLINCTCDNVLRLLPPLVIERKQVDKALAALDEVLSRLER